ncbi:MAG: ADOP family duplicated permease, partial [Longimicrobiales bacterium]
PRFPSFLIRVILPADPVTDSIIGDLAQEFHERSRSEGSRAAARWYWKQALAVAGFALSDRLAGHCWARPSRVEEGPRDLTGAPSFRPWRGLGQIGQDLRYALRQILRRPGVTFVALVSLALGIGANTAIFTVGNSVLARPLNVSEPERMALVYTSQLGGERYGNTSYPDYLDYKEGNRVFSGLAAHTTAPMALSATGQPEVVWGQLVSGDFFTVLGVEPWLGRTFLPEEDGAPDTHPVVVLSFRTWRDRFGSDPGVLGRTVRINDYPFTVVGVAQPGFTGLIPAVEPALWAPLAMVDRALPYTPNTGSRVDPWLQLVGRMRPGVSIADAQAGMEVLASNLADEYPGTNGNKGIVLETLDAGRVGDPRATAGARRLLNLLTGVVGFVLLIACFNVANLELSKAAGRRREIALRHSLGASRWRIVRQLLVESVVLALAAGGFGLVVGVYSIRTLGMLQAQAEVPIPVPAGLDHRVLAFTLLLALSTGLLFGLAPALQVLKPGHSETLKDQGYALSRGRAAGRLQRAMVVAQVALSLVLLTGAGLLLRSLSNTLAIDPGFDLREGVVVPVNLGYGQYGEEEGRSLQRSLLERIRTLPGVESASLSAFVPLGMVHGHHDVFVEGYEPAPNELMLVKRNMVSSGYFETMGIRISRGRAIDEGDTEDAPPVAIINEAMARRFWPDQDPVGQTVRADLGTVYTVVGVMEDGKYGSILEPTEPYLVLPLGQAEYVQRVNLVVKTREDPRAMIHPLSSEVQKLVPGLPSSTILTIPRYLEYSQASARGAAVMVSIFGVLALILASVGLYGVMAYNVSQRTREFGVRFAVGATRGVVTKMVLFRGLKMTFLGLVLGGLLAVAVTRILSGFLYDVSPFDPLVFAAGALVLLGVGQIASYLPARFASRADPTTALRAE